MRKKAIADFLVNHSASRPVSFHMPGHKGADIYRENGFGDFLDNIMDCDITEIPGADNLFQSESIIKETMDKYKALYGAKETYLLINGSSAGLIAAIMSVVSKGDKLVVARNAHKSIFNGMTLAGANPVYAYPEMIEEFDISGIVSLKEIKRCLEESPGVKGVIIPSPNYYGICSDIESIANYLHSIDKVLIVDQAHGAHLPFFSKFLGEKSMAAEYLGADIVINSTHKTLATFTQSAIVNLCSDRIDKYLFEDKLQLIESTSPSYLLMASMDINAELIREKGRELMGQWKDNLDYFYSEAAKINGLRVMKHTMLDRSKLNLDMSALGIDGLTLEEELMERGIFAELVTGNILMCMTGIGNKRSDYEKLIAALRNIADESSKGDTCRNTSKVTRGALVGRLEQKDIPKEKINVELSGAAGFVCASSIIPYPPGIPIACPGEVLTEEVVTYVKALREKGEKVMGVDDHGRVVVGK